MEEIIQLILKEEALAHPNKLFEKVMAQLSQSEKIRSLSSQLIKIVKENYTMSYEIEAFQEAHLPIANANAKKAYSFTFDLKDYPHIKITHIDNLEPFGLIFDPESYTISGKPLLAATTTLDIYFYCETDPNRTNHKKSVSFIINADPKDLWQNIPFDKNALFYKEDETSYAGNFLDKKIVVASKRGRSHAHQGTSRDDDFYLLSLPKQWEVIAVADGAGSAPYARKGSEEATHFICNSFNDEDFLSLIDTEIEAYFTTEDSIPHKSIIINAIYRKIRELYHHLETLAENEHITLKDLHTTLIFALMKKTEEGYFLLSFGVGDCPICILSEDQEQVTLLNQLDIGEFGGGTRFITMPEIYSNEGEIPVAKRFNIQRFTNFSKLFLMTDGIYDPKFVVENNLNKIEHWKAFLADLNGENEDACKVDFQEDSHINQQLLSWMDFWSKGNSDDRTLAIIY